MNDSVSVSRMGRLMLMFRSMGRLMLVFVSASYPTGSTSVSIAAAIMSTLLLTRDGEEAMEEIEEEVENSEADSIESNDIVGKDVGVDVGEEVGDSVGGEGDVVVVVDGEISKPLNNPGAALRERISFSPDGKITLFFRGVISISLITSSMLLFSGPRCPLSFSSEVTLKLVVT